MSCGTCGIQASNTLQGDTGVPAGAPTTRPRCPICEAFLASGGSPCANPRCPGNRLEDLRTFFAAEGVTVVADDKAGPGHYRLNWPADRPPAEATLQTLRYGGLTPTGASCAVAPANLRQLYARLGWYSPGRQTYRLNYTTYHGRTPRRSGIKVVFEDGILDATSKRTLASMAARQAWGHINVQYGLLSPQRDGLLAVMYSTAGHGGYVVVSDTPLDYTTPAHSHADWNLPHGQQFYVYTFEEDSGWAIFEAHDFDRVTAAQWRQRHGPVSWDYAEMRDPRLRELAATADETGEGLRRYRAQRRNVVMESLWRNHEDHMPPRVAWGQEQVSPAAAAVLRAESAHYPQPGPGASAEDVQEYESYRSAAGLAREQFAYQRAGAWGEVPFAIVEQNEQNLAAGHGLLVAARVLYHTKERLIVYTDLDTQETRLVRSNEPAAPLLHSPNPGGGS